MGLRRDAAVRKVQGRACRVNAEGAPGSSAEIAVESPDAAR